MTFIVPTECPRCKHSESWSVWVGAEGFPLGKCHRASCGNTIRFTDSLPLPPKAKEPRHYTRPVTPLTYDHLQLLRRKFDFSELALTQLDGYCEADDRFILPVFGPTGYNKRGVVAYSFNTSPKSLTYNAKPEQPFIHWADPDCNTKAIVVVEDWFSAEKVADTGIAAGVALMGTNLTQGMVTELAERAAALDVPVCVALDRDAYVKTIGYIAKYREQFPRGLYAWSLRQDLKYEPIERIKRAIDGERDFTGDVEQPRYA